MTAAGTAGHGPAVATAAEGERVRLVVAVLMPTELEPVRHALAAVHVTRLTVCDAQEHLLPRGDAAAGAARSAGDASAATPPPIALTAVMEIAVNDDFLDRTLDTIAAAMHRADPTGGRDAGERLFVLPMHEAIQIYREVRGQEAI